MYARLKINFQTFIESTQKDSDYCTIKKKKIQFINIIKVNNTHILKEIEISRIFF